MARWRSRRRLAFFGTKATLTRDEQRLARRLLGVWRAGLRQALALLQADSTTIPETFWDELRAQQQAALAPWLEHLVQYGLESGRVQVGMPVGAGKAVPEIGIQVDWNLVDQNALAWAQAYTYDLVGGITQTTREKLQSAIGDWLRAGEAFPQLRERVEAIFDDPKRAELIAVTETTRAVAEGNTQAWQAAGVWGREWRTARDELVCPVCGPLHRQRAMIGQAFPGNITNPPAHPNCRCVIVPVVEPERSPAPGIDQE
ncbi:MAG: minor capsid protein [Anaerolineae bacterium]